MHPLASTPVADTETLSRVVRHDTAWREWPLLNGVRQISSQAFTRPGLKPSVDRLVILPSPADSKFHPNDGLITLLASEIRSIKVAAAAHNHSTDIIPKPSDRPAHALVELFPEADKTAYRMLHERLAALASWLEEPS